MIHSMFSVYDQKAEAFLPPFMMPKAQQAQRIFSDCVNSSDHQFAAHPEDYTLFHIGNFDDESGVLHPKPTPTSMGLGLEYVIQAQSPGQTDFIGEGNGAEIRTQQGEPSIQPGSESGDTKK